MILHRDRRCACAVAACLGIAALACVAGCSGDAPEPEEAQTVSRAEDPEYVAKLQESVAERNVLLSEMAEARDAYEAARAADPDGERTKELEAKVAECDAKLKDQRVRVGRAVTGRIWKEFQDRDAQRKGEAR